MTVADSMLVAYKFNHALFHLLSCSISYSSENLHLQIAHIRLGVSTVCMKLNASINTNQACAAPVVLNVQQITIPIQWLCMCKTNYSYDIFVLQVLIFSCLRRECTMQINCTVELYSTAQATTKALYNTSIIICILVLWMLLLTSLSSLLSSSGFCVWSIN